MTNNYAIHAIRLKPGQDLKLALTEYLVRHSITAGWMITCVGSITQYRLRFANQHESKLNEGYFEILSLSGTLSTNGAHLHLCIADPNGEVLGGHLMEGCLVYTTAEIVIGVTNALVFSRLMDETTGFKELRIDMGNGKSS